MQPMNLKFRPSAIHGMYGVNYYFQTENGELQRFQFKTSVVYCGQYMEDYAIYHIRKDDFVVNKNISDDYLYAIAKKCAEVIYPLAILVDKTGKLTFVKTDDIGKKWRDARVEIDRYYKGELVEQYLNNIENMLNDKTQIEQFVSTDLFFSQLFSIVYGNMENRQEFESKISLVPMKRSLKFNSLQDIDMESVRNPENSTIVLLHSGETNESYLFGVLYDREGMNEQEYHSKVSAKYQLSYGLNKNDLSVDSVAGNFELFLNERSYSTIMFSAFRLYENQVGYEKDNYFIEAEKKQRSKDNSLLNKIKEFFK